MPGSRPVGGEKTAGTGIAPHSGQVQARTVFNRDSPSRSVLRGHAIFRRMNPSPAVP
ncbi:hypothetical protein [Breoghania sp.]|uniref:hypothetical protein n=1 Tax=Breoghania sp. TaxID=2065378 RepID=UPI00260600CF|nr:hypothetical protein [Breoghania sp.]